MLCVNNHVIDVALVGLIYESKQIALCFALFKNLFFKRSFSKHKSSFPLVFPPVSNAWCFSEIWSCLYKMLVCPGVLLSV